MADITSDIAGDGWDDDEENVDEGDVALEGKALYLVLTFTFHYCCNLQSILYE